MRKLRAPSSANSVYYIQHILISQRPGIKNYEIPDVIYGALYKKNLIPSSILSTPWRYRAKSV
ncbi:hypothetical protein BVRB_6g138710 [Beta vulgaris subsp. vulgaris]|nr:hypothetical protein BVRB_6g138710 [Beta vulgaris subsp. vulgaris]